jgi:hypothetical protein
VQIVGVLVRGVVSSWRAIFLSGMFMTHRHEGLPLDTDLTVLGIAGWVGGRSFRWRWLQSMAVRRRRHREAIG